MISLLCGIYNRTPMNISMKQKQTHRHREQMCGCQGEGGWQREGLGVGISRRKLVYIGWINYKVLLYITGNYIQYAVINQNGKGYVKEYYTAGRLQSLVFQPHGQRFPHVFRRESLPAHNRLQNQSGLAVRDQIHLSDQADHRDSQCDTHAVVRPADTRRVADRFRNNRHLASRSLSADSRRERVPPAHQRRRCG